MPPYSDNTVIIHMTETSVTSGSHRLSRQKPQDAGQSLFQIEIMQQ
jgi:hypothetical protein